MNTSTSARVAAITVSAAGVPDQVVTVTQAGAEATLAVTPPSQSVTESAGTTDFTVTSNSSWTASSDATWCTVTASGSGNAILEATYEANNSSGERSANITVTVAGLSPVIVQVIQDGTSVGISENNVNSVRIFPNPAKDFIKISISKSSDNSTISLIDLTGKIIIERLAGNDQEITLNVQDLPSGYYFLKVLSKDEAITKKVILAE
jgi:hypothetical protein